MSVQCQSHKCQQEAVGGFLWPGREQPQPACDRCIRRAATIASALGMVLPTYPLSLFEERVAAQVRDALAKLEPL